MARNPYTNYLIFNGKNILDFQCYVSGGGIFGSPDWDYDTIKIPGRDGDVLVSNKRMNQGTIAYDAFIVDDFVENYDAMRDFLLQDGEYHKLEDTYHPDSFVWARFNGNFDPETYQRNEGGAFKLEFSCIPRRYLRSGDEPIEYDDARVYKINNPTNNAAYPLIKVSGGKLSFSINGLSYSLDASNYDTYMDCETLDVYTIQNGVYNSENYRLTFKGKTPDFPVLKPGVNELSITSFVDKVSITPRWYMR